MVAAADIGNTLVGVAAVISAVSAALIGVRNSKKIDAGVKKVEQVHNELRVGNGKTIAALSELAEGRRIRQDVLPQDRTDEERRYVGGLEEDDAAQRADDARRDLPPRPNGAA